MATEEHSIRVSVDSTDVTRAERSLNSLTSATTQTERALNSTSSAARSSAAALSGLGASSAGVHSMTAAMSSYSRSATQAAANTQSAAREITSLSSSASRSSDSMRSLSSAISLIGLGSFAKDVLNTNIEMENLRARLDATFGSMAKGQQAFEDILRIAKETPQSVEEISKSFVMLKNFGIEPTIKVMQDLTNLTSKVGGNADTLSGIVRSLGQAYAKGKLQAEEANQMIERGVPVYSLLSKELHKTTAEIMDMMTKGELTRPVIEKLIAAMGDSSVGASTKMMETLGGKISMLGDSWHQFENALLGDKSEGLIKTIVDGWSTVLDGFTARMNQSISGQIVDLKVKLNDAENRKSFLSKGMQAVGILDSPEQIKTQIAGLQQKRLADFQTNRQYEQSQKQEKATQAEADAIAKKTKANEEFTKKFGTASQREKQEIDDLKGSMGELTKAQLAQVHAKYFSSQENKSHAASIKQVNKEQSEYQRLIESTPYGEYNATIDKLTEGLKRGGEAFRATYSTGIDEANKKLLDSTQYVKDHTTALKEQQQALEGTARGKFEKGYSELMTQKPYMSDTEYSAGQDKLNADYLTQQQGVDFKTPAEQGKEALKAFNDEMDNTSKAFDKLGNSGSMAFDGILGGISAVAGAASSFSEEFSKISDKQQASQEKYDAVIKSIGVTESEKADATKKFAADKIKLDAQAFSAEISGARQIAGATAKLFGEKSAARKAFHAIEMGMSVIEMAMAAKKMIVDVAAGAAKMFSQGGFAGFAGVAAMAAIMGGLGFAMAGGGDKVTDLTTPETSTTGSVLGSDGASASIKNIVDTLNSIHASEYVELQDLNANFKDLVQQTTKGTALALQERGAFSFSTNAMKSGNTGASEKQFAMGLGTTAISAGLAAAGVGTGLATSVLAGAINASVALTGAASTVTSALVGTSAALMSGGLAAAAAMGGIGLLVGGAIYGISKLLGIGKVKYEAVGGGIVMNAQKFMIDGMQQQVTVFDYSKIKKTVTGWFSDDVTYYDVINRIDNPLTKLFTGIFANVESTLLQASTNIFKDSSLLNTDVTLPKIKLSLKSGEKNNAENQKKIEDAINKASDDIASQAFGRYLSAFQQIGEGLYETTIRLSAQAAVASGGMEKLGMKTNLTGLGLITFSDSLTQAFGGLKEFKAGIDSLYEAFTSDPQKLIDSKKQVADFLVSLKAPVSAGLPAEITTKADAAKFTDYLLKTQTGIAGVAAQVLSASNVKPDDINAKKLFNRLISSDINRDAKTALKNAGVENITTTVLSEALKLSKWSIAGENDMTPINKLYAPLIEYAKQNANFLASNQNLKTIRANKELEQSLTDLGKAMPETTAEAAKLSEELTKLSDDAAIQVKTFEGLTKATLNVISSQEKLAEAGKYVTDFSKSISAWIKNVRATTGSPVNQLGMAKANFEEQLKLAKFGATAEEKRSALSGITGYADTYMNAIKSYYATSEEGQKAIEDIMSQVSGLGQSVDVQELQLGALNDIKDGIYEIPKGISDANAVLWQKLIDSTKAAGATALKDPTVDNLLNYNALAKIVLLIDKSLQQGADAAFLDALISSVAGESGLQAGIELIIDNVDFEAAKKEQIIANVLSSFNENRLTLTNFEFDVQAAIDAAKENVLASWGEPKLDVTTDEIIEKISEVQGLSVTLATDLNAEKTLNLTTDTANQKLTDSILLSGEFTAAAEFVPVMDVDTTTVIEKIADVISSATTATAALSALSSARAADAEKAVADAAKVADAERLAAVNAKLSADAAKLTKEEKAAAFKAKLSYADYAELLNKNGTKSLMNGYAKGGIANTPSIFGEAGAEAAVPLPDGRSIPVTLYNSANDSSVSSEETIAELKAQNNKLEVLVNTLMATSKAEREKTQELIDAMNGLRSDTRLAARG
jgi:tape measure domain-containing protein